MIEDKITIEDNERALVSQILKALKSIRYGYVQITVQDSRPVQIDKAEKIRLDGQGRH
ncbi:MAG: YezD family protein [Candidatus Omnitrophota bacterium]